MSATSSRLRLGLIAIPAAAILALSGCSVINQASDLVQGKSDVFALQVNDCFNDETAETISSVKVIECADEHDNEIYHEYMLASEIFPGGTYVEDIATDDADEKCFAEFEAFIGASYDATTLDFSYLYPTSESWSNDDRSIQCIAYSTDGKISGSLKAKGADYPLE